MEKHYLYILCDAIREKRGLPTKKQAACALLFIQKCLLLLFSEIENEALEKKERRMYFMGNGKP